MTQFKVDELTIEKAIDNIVETYPGHTVHFIRCKNPNCTNKGLWHVAITHNRAKSLDFGARKQYFDRVFLGHGQTWRDGLAQALKNIEAGDGKDELA